MSPTDSINQVVKRHAQAIAEALAQMQRHTKIDGEGYLDMRILPKATVYRDWAKRSNIVKEFLAIAASLSVKINEQLNKGDLRVCQLPQNS